MFLTVYSSSGRSRVLYARVFCLCLAVVAVIEDWPSDPCTVLFLVCCTADIDFLTTFTFTLSGNKRHKQPQIPLSEVT